MTHKLAKYLAEEKLITIKISGGENATDSYFYKVHPEIKHYKYGVAQPGQWNVLSPNMTNNLIINVMKGFSRINLMYGRFDHYDNHVMGEPVCSVVIVATWMSDYTIDYCTSLQQCYNSCFDIV